MIKWISNLIKKIFPSLIKNKEVESQKPIEKEKENVEEQVTETPEKEPIEVLIETIEEEAKPKPKEEKEVLLIHLKRLKQNKNTTLGQISIGDKKWWTLEDTLRKNKIPKITAIPTGRNEIILRKEGRIHKNYLRKFGAEWHKGTLWLQSVVNFQYILIHYGNFKEDTEGCPLLGTTWGYDKNGDYAVYNSIKAYEEFYPIVRDWLLTGKKVFIEIENEENLVYFD